MRQRDFFPDGAKAFQHLQCREYRLADRSINAFADILFRHPDAQSGNVTGQRAEVVGDIDFSRGRILGIIACDGLQYIRGILYCPGKRADLIK
ncbi:hypothetical protein D3C73_1520370 [compost metagenome]